MRARISISSSAERRIRREGRHAARRELALKLRREGKTLAAIGAVLGVSTTRAFQMVRKAERLIQAQVGGPLCHGTSGCPALPTPGPEVIRMLETQTPVPKNRPTRKF